MRKLIALSLIFLLAMLVYGEVGTGAFVQEDFPPQFSKLHFYRWMITGVVAFVRNFFSPLIWLLVSIQEFPCVGGE